MRAVYATALGGDDPLANVEVGDLPVPSCGPGWVTVRVVAASLNHHDLWTLRGVSSKPVDVPHVLGCDAAGVIDDDHGQALPGGLSRGDRVVLYSVVGCGDCAACQLGDIARCADPGVLSEGALGGALADYVVVPAANLVALPSEVSWEVAACLPTAYLTAYRMLFVRAGLRPGMSVLIHGAGGGVATAALLLARATGIRALVTARDAARRERAVTLGAALAVAADREGQARVRAATGGVGVDAVIETVGEPTWEMSLRCLRPGGTVVVSGATGGGNPPARLQRVFWHQLTIAGSTMGTIDELRALVAMCANGSLSPLIDSVVGLDAVPGALSRLATGTQFGKIVCRVSRDAASPTRP